MGKSNKVIKHLVLLIHLKTEHTSCSVPEQFKNHTREVFTQAGSFCATDKPDAIIYFFKGLFLFSKKVMLPVFSLIYFYMLEQTSLPSIKTVYDSDLLTVVWRITMYLYFGFPYLWLN